MSFSATALSTRRVFPVDPIYVADVDTLRGITTSSMIAFVTGLFSSGVSSDPVGWYIRDDNDTTTADNGSTVIVSATGKRWRLMSSVLGSIPFLQAGTGAVLRDMQAKVREQWISVADFGASNVGVDATAAIAAAKVVQGTTKMLFTPAGLYLYSGTNYTVDSDHIWLNRGYTGILNPMTVAQTNAITITQQSSSNAVHDPTLSRIGIAVSSWALGAQHTSGFRSNLYNSSTDGNGCTAFYGHAQTDTDAGWSAVLHGEIRHGGGTGIGMNVEAGSYTALGNFYGAVLNNSTASLFAAGTLNTLTGLPAVSHPDATALLVQGTNNTDPMGGWVYGFDFHANSMRAGGTCIDFNANAGVAHLIDSAATAVSTVADIRLQGNSAIGLLLAGTYTNLAMRINAGQRIGLEGTSTIKFGYDTGSSSIQLLSGANNRVSFTMTATPALNIAGTKVVGAQETGWTAMTGSANKVAVYDVATVTLAQLAGRVKSIQAALTTHGLIAA